MTIQYWGIIKPIVSDPQFAYPLTDQAWRCNHLRWATKDGSMPMSLNVPAPLATDKFWKVVAHGAVICAMGILSFVGVNVSGRFGDMQKDISDTKSISAGHTIALDNLLNSITQLRTEISQINVQQREDETKAYDIGNKAAAMDAKLSTFLAEVRWSAKGKPVEPYSVPPPADR